jgi:hypothetical protein
MNAIAKKILGVIDQAISAKPKDPRRLIGAAVVKFDPGAAPTKAERSKALELERAYQAAYDATIQFSDGAARKAYFAHVNAHADHAGAGTLGDVRTRGLESIASEYLAKQRAAKECMRQKSAEAGQLAQPIKQRFVPALEAFVAQREKIEADEADAFGLVPVPSAVTAAAKTILVGLKNQLASGVSGGRPKDVFFFINFD